MVYVRNDKDNEALRALCCSTGFGFYSLHDDYFSVRMSVLIDPYWPRLPNKDDTSFGHFYERAIAFVTQASRLASCYLHYEMTITHELHGSRECEVTCWSPDFSGFND